MEIRKRSLVTFMLVTMLLQLSLMGHSSVEGHSHSGDGEWSIQIERKTEEAAAARELYQMFDTYRQINGRLPDSFVEIAEVDPIYRNKLSPNTRDSYLIIKQHETLEQLPDWKLVLINKQPTNLSSSANGRVGRYLVYIDGSGKLKQIAETEGWFAEWIGDAIPGITFDEVSAGEEAVVEIPTASLVEETVEAVEEVTPPEPATKKPDEVKTPDTTKEPAEQSSNSWLWIMGALVVVGGIALAVRRKS